MIYNAISQTMQNRMLFISECNYFIDIKWIIHFFRCMYKISSFDIKNYNTFFFCMDKNVQ